MPDKDETTTIDIKISDILIAKETENEIKTRVPRTYDDKERYLILNQDDIEKINNGKTLLATLEKDKIYNLIDKAGNVVEPLNGEQLANKYYDSVPQKKKTVAEETVFNEEDETKTDKENTSQQSQDKKDSEQNIKLSHSVLDSKHTKFEVKRAKLEDKNSKLQEKIKKAETKIEKWQAKKDDSVEALKQCRKLLDIPVLPAPVVQFLKLYEQSKANKISSLEDKLTDKKQSITSKQNKIEKNNLRISKISKKLTKLENIDKFLNNMHTSQGRRENFVNGLQEFRKSSLTRSKKKLDKLEIKIAVTQKQFDKTHFAEEKVKLRNTLHSLNKQKTFLKDKITKLEGMDKKLEAVNLLPDSRADEIINESCEKISSAISNMPDITTNQAVDNVLDTSEQVIDNKFTEIKEEPSQNAEDRLKEEIAYKVMSSEVPQDLPSFQNLYNLFDEPAETPQKSEPQSDKKIEQQRKSSPLSRDTIKRSAATIKAKEQGHEAPKQLKSQGQEL